MALSTQNSPELTQEQVQKILVQPLTDASIFLSSGPRVFDTNGSPVRIPKLGTTDFEVGWVGENEKIPTSDIDFDDIHLLPSTMKGIKHIALFSNEMARQSVVSLDQTMQDKLVTDVVNKLDNQFLSAGGDGVTTPKGLFAWSGTQKLPVGGELTFDHLLDAWGMALAANVNTASAKWLLTSQDFVALRKIKDTSGQYVLNADPTADAVFRLFGCPVIVTNRIPNTTGATPTGRAALVDFSQIAVARDMAPTVKILDQTFGDYDQIGIRVVTRYDAAPLNPEAVVVLDGITR